MKKVKAHLQDENDLKRTLMRISHEIIEKNPDLNRTAIVGIRTRGEIIAERIAKSINKITKTEIDNGTLDVTFYRDDFRTNVGSPQVGPSDIKFDVSDKHIILIDDLRLITNNWAWNEKSYGNINFLQAIQDLITSINKDYKFTRLDGHVEKDVLCAYIE